MDIIKTYKNWIIGVTIIVFFLLLRGCNSSQVDKLHGENKIKTEQVKKLQKAVDSIEKARVAEKDSISEENNKRALKQKQLEEKAIASEQRVKSLESKNKKAKDKIKNLSLDAVAQELNTNYSSKDATATANSVEMKNSMPYQVLETISDANTCAEVVKEKDGQLVAKDSLNSSLVEDKKALSLNLFSAEKTIDGYKDLNRMQTDLNKGLDKENKKLRTKNFFTKALVPVSLAVGIFVGIQTSK